MISYEKTQNSSVFIKNKATINTTTYAHKLFELVAIMWAVLQIWFASPLQFSLAEFFQTSSLILTDREIKALHLAFGMFLLFLYYPAFSVSKDSNPPNYRLIGAICAVLPSLYVFIFYNSLAERIGSPTVIDVSFSVMGVILLIEAARRTVGMGMAVIASTFLLYSLFGEALPSILAHKNYTLSTLSSYQWLTSEGVFGTAIGVSANFVFLYVLFGTLLDKIGAGNFFIKLSFSLLGKFRAGPAKASVVASGLMGMISGSSIANTITIGTLTIPLMKKMGFSAEKAGAIEVSAGVNSQIMPPIMGAAAFLIAEYLGIPYGELIKHAFLPATLSYIALLYLIHLEACKLGIKAITTTSSPTEKHNTFTLSKYLQVLLGFLLVASAVGGAYILIDGVGKWRGIKTLFPHTARYIIYVSILFIYLGLLKYKSLFSEETEMAEGINLTQAASPLAILRTGVHFFLPIILLVWCLTIENLSPALSAYWTIIFLIFILLTQNIFLSLFKGEKILFSTHLKESLSSLKECLIFSSKNMIVIAVATATAGTIVGSVSLTGIGLSISEIVDRFSNGSFFIALILTGIISLILGMGVPTTACYIIVATLMVPVLNYITIKNALPVPAICLHLFVFYFGLMADVTPPVGLATYAASAISRGSPLKTGAYAFLYNIRTILLPFLFIYNPKLILYGVENWQEIIQIITLAIIGMLVISSATQNYFIVKSKLYESIALMFIGIACLCPQLYINNITPPFRTIPLYSLSQVNNCTPVKLTFKQIDLSGELNEMIVLFELPLNKETLAEQLQEIGLNFGQANQNIIVTSVEEESIAYKAKLYAGSQLSKIELTARQVSKFWIQVPALIGLSLIIILQRKRSNVPPYSKAL